MDKRLITFLSLCLWGFYLTISQGLPTSMNAGNVFAAETRPAAATPALAGISGFHIRQLCRKPTGITAYVDLETAGGSPVDIRHVKLTGTLGEKPVTLTRFLPFAETGEGVAVVFLVDVSKSLRPEQFAKIKEALATWIGGMGTKDRGSVITFGAQVRVVQDFTGNKDELKRAVSSLGPTDMKTGLYLGIVKALEVGRKTAPGLPDRRVIITLSDGFDVFSGGVTKTEVLDALRESPIPLYAIGYYKPPHTEAKEKGLKILGEIARKSGGDFVRGVGVPVQDLYADLQKRVKQVFVADMACPACPGDGNMYRLQLNLGYGSQVMTDGMDIRMTPVETPVASPSPSFFIRYKKIIIVLVVISLVLLTALVWFFAKRKKELLETNQDVVPAPDCPAPVGLSTKAVQANDPTKDINTKKKDGIPIRLSVVGDNVPKRNYDLHVKDRAIIGRNNSCDLCFPDDEVSGNHCELARKVGYLEIRDLGSTNGTFVNGVPISSPFILQEGDLILIGRIELRITFIKEKL